MSLTGGIFLVRFHRKMILSMPAEATYLQEGQRSRVIIDSLCPLRLRIKVGSSEDRLMQETKGQKLFVSNELQKQSNYYFCFKCLNLKQNKVTAENLMPQNIYFDQFIQFDCSTCLKQLQDCQELPTQVMKENMSLDMNRPPSTHKGVPKYSDKYKDVLERAYKRQQASKSKPKQVFFYRVKTIGVGAFSFVYLVTEQHSGSIFAQKSISKKSIAPELFTQIKMHLTLHHANIVNLYHIYSQESYVQLIMDYAGDSLFTLRKNKKLQTVGNQQISISILRQLIQAICYLHSRNIVHADIKLQNILYLDGVIKLCDFGYAHRPIENIQISLDKGDEFNNQISKQSIQKEVVGTFQYLDPEYVQGKYSEFSRDVWAIGIVAYELLVGKNPFEGMQQNEKWSKMLKIKQIETKHLSISTGMHKLLQLTLCPIQKRGSIYDLSKLEIMTKESKKDDFNDFKLII